GGHGLCHGYRSRALVFHTGRRRSLCQHVDKLAVFTPLDIESDDLPSRRTSALTWRSDSSPTKDTGCVRTSHRDAHHGL
ncbi:MAG: hypothetical protein SGPRY_013038, partial [Prymnesium sp.]